MFPILNNAESPPATQHSGGVLPSSPVVDPLSTRCVPHQLTDSASGILPTDDPEKAGESAWRNNSSFEAASKQKRKDRGTASDFFAATEAPPTTDGATARFEVDQRAPEKDHFVDIKKPPGPPKKKHKKDHKKEKSSKKEGKSHKKEKSDKKSQKKEDKHSRRPARCSVPLGRGFRGI